MLLSQLLGTVYYLPFSKDSQTVSLPDIDEPLPPTWKALQVRNFTIIFVALNLSLGTFLQCLRLQTALAGLPDVLLSRRPA